MDETDGPAPVKKFAPCKLETPTQQLLKLIFDEDMFKEAMASLEIGMLLATSIYSDLLGHTGIHV